MWRSGTINHLPYTYLASVLLCIFTNGNHKVRNQQPHPLISFPIPLPLLSMVLTHPPTHWDVSLCISVRNDDSKLCLERGTGGNHPHRTEHTHPPSGSLDEATCRPGIQITEIYTENYIVAIKYDKVVTNRQSHLPFHWFRSSLAPSLSSI